MPLVWILRSMLIVFLLDTGTSFACPFKKLVSAMLDKKAARAARTNTLDPIEDPVPPAWADSSEGRKANVELWEKAVLAEAEIRWRVLGVEYERISYKEGEALRVVPHGQGEINGLSTRADSVAKKSAYHFQIVFSPRSLVREWPEKKAFYLIGGSFQGGTNVVHLPFQSVEKNEISPTFHHEFLHAVFDYFREQGLSSAYHGSFHSRDNVNPMWKGPHYTEFMSLEELATFPLNLRLYALELDQLVLAAGPVEKSEMARKLLGRFQGHALSHAVNAQHARDYLGHISKHLDDPHSSIETKYEMGKPDAKGRRSVTVKWNWANIEYRMVLTEESLQPVKDLLNLEKPVGTPPLSPKLEAGLKKIAREQLALQYQMAKESTTASKELIEKLVELQKKARTTLITEEDVQIISELLKRPRDLSLKYIRSKV